MLATEHEDISLDPNNHSESAMVNPRAWNSRADRKPTGAC